MKMNIGTYLNKKALSERVGLILLTGLVLFSKFCMSNGLSFYGQTVFGGVPSGMIRDIEVVEDVIFLAAENGVFKVIGAHSETIPFNQINDETGIISDIVYDPTGYLWIVEYGVGVFKYDLKSGKSEAVYEDLEGIEGVWNLALTDKNIALTMIDKLHIVDRKSKRIESWEEKTFPKNLYNVYSIVQENNDIILAISKNYLIEMDVKNKTMKSIDIREEFPSLSEFTAITVHNNKRYLGGPEGIYISDKNMSGKDFVKFKEGLNLKRPVNKIYVSGKSEIWIAAGGIFKLSNGVIEPLDWMKPILMSDAIHSVLSINELSGEEIIFSSSQLGLVSLSKSQRAVNYLNLNENFYQRNITSAGTTIEGFSYIRDSKNVHVISDNSGTLEEYSQQSVSSCIQKEALNFEEIYSRKYTDIDFCDSEYNHSFEEKKGNYYIYYQTEVGAKYFLIGNNLILDEIEAPRLITDSIVLSTGEIMGYDIYSNVHIQLSKYNWKTLWASDTKWEGITCLVEIKDYYLVCTSGNGLRQIDKSDGTISISGIIKNYDIRFVRSGFLSENRNLWLSTNMGLFVYSLDKSYLFKLDRSNGIFDVDFEYKGIYGIDRKIVVVGDRYAYIIDELALLSSLIEGFELPLKVNIFKVETKDKDGIVKTYYPNFSDEKIVLSSNYRSLTFSFSSSSYIKSYSQNLEFRVLGYVDEWQRHTSSSATLNLQDIDYGDYEFQARVFSDKDSNLNPYEKIFFKIGAPFYLTDYALFIYFIMFVFSIFMLKLGFYRRLSSYVFKSHFFQNILGDYGREYQDKVNELAKNELDYFKRIIYELRSYLNIASSSLMRLEVRGQDLDKINFKHIFYNVERAKLLLENTNEIDKLGAPSVESYKSYSMLDVYNIAISMENLAKQKNQILDVSIKGDGYVSLLKGSLELIVSNLVSNAIAYTSERGHIKFISSIDDRSFRIVVIDNGRGIDKIAQREIFNRFSFSEKTKDGNEYRGLGLPIVKELLLINQGDLKLDSVVGEGSKFVLTFPVDDVQANNSKFDSIKHIKKWQEKPAIMLVDGSRDYRNYLFNLFSQDYRCLVARDGKQALNILQNHQVNLIITDLMLQVMNGLDFISRIRANERLKKLPVIVLTAKVDSDLKIQILRANVNCFLTKPILDEELLLNVAHLISLDTLYQEETTRFENSKRQSSCINLPELTTEKDMSFYLNFIAVLEKNYSDEHFNREKAASQLLMSVRSLNRRLADLFEYNFSEFLARFRIDKSTALLMKGASVMETCVAVGFGTPSYFSTTFKRIMGVPPKHYYVQTLLKKEE